MTVEAKNAIKISCRYAHKDKNIRKELRMHLKPLTQQLQLRIWYDAEINPGVEWEKEI